MRQLGSYSLLFVVLLLSNCCTTYIGYNRYTLKINCDKVKIDNKLYKITRIQQGLVIDGHTISRGIYRKTKPWLYVHEITDSNVDVTFDVGGKPSYPLYTGASGSIFDVYSHPWKLSKSTNILFSNNWWLISHRWNENGIFFDLQHNMGNESAWQLVKADIFVPNNGSEVTVNEINTKIKILSFNRSEQNAQVSFIKF